MLRRVTVLAFLALASLSAAGCKDRSSGEGPHIAVKLVADQDSVAPGSAFTLGIKFTPAPGWHIYWKNPGDSGQAPRFEWTIPTGATIKPNLWPYPERIDVGPLTNYGYGTVLLPFPANLSTTTATGDSLLFKVLVKWLVCKDECVPGEAALELSLPVSERAGEPSRYTALFSDTYVDVPAPLSRVSIAVEEQEQSVKIALIPLGDRFMPKTIAFFPEDRGIIANAAPQLVARDGSIVTITLKRDPNRKDPIERIRGVLYSPGGWSEKGTPKAVSIDTTADDQSRVEVPPIQNSTTMFSADGDDSPGFFTALLFAFLGGIILNLMPCVFPVLSIKILGFVEQSKQDERSIKLHGGAFSAGVLVSFWILAGLLLALRASGEQLGWGFQLQSPTFVVVMIFTFLTLGFLFLSDLVIGRYLQSLAGSAKLNSHLSGSFLNGVLATAVATPCTAPFMGSAIAATLTLPAFLSLLIFTSLGLGMSAPYLLLSLRPSLLRFLPRPGAWMETFKQLMAFPLFASVLWLIRVFARQMGMEPPGLDVLMDLLWGTLIVGFGFWVLLKAEAARGREARMGLHLMAIFCLILGFVTAVPTRGEVDASQSRACSTEGSQAPQPDKHGLVWEPYSDKRVSDLVASGRTVYIDFTAEWCITCQVNEARVFGSKEVRDRLRTNNIALIKADWTSSNPAITEALRRFGRNSVPLNVILAPNRKPVILPNVLTPSIVLEALGGQ